MLQRIAIFVLFATVCFCAPQSGGENSGNRYSCECSPVPSDDGIRTLQCHCTEKAGNSLGVVNPGGSSGNNSPNSKTPIPSQEATATPTIGGHENSTGIHADYENLGGPLSDGPGSKVPQNKTVGSGEESGSEGFGNKTGGEEGAESGFGEPVGNNTSGPGGPGNNTAVGPEEPAGGNKTIGGSDAASDKAAADSSPSKAPPVGDATTYVACMKRDDESHPKGKPEYDWLKSNGDDVTLPGKWVTVPCKGGSKYVFLTDEASYKKANAGCKEQGFQLAQPADHSFSGYYGFQVGETIEEYFSWPTMLTWNRVKPETAEGCSLYGGDTSGQSFGDTTTSILCIKKGDAKTSTKPESKWLPDPSWGTAKISGSWLESKTCSYGDITPFQVLASDYKKVLEGCKKEGYDIAQPANSATSSWYPFQVGKELQEYYRSAKSGWVSYDYFLEAAVGADKC